MPGIRRDVPPQRLSGAFTDETNRTGIVGDVHQYRFWMPLWDWIPMPDNLSRQRIRLPLPDEEIEFQRLQRSNAVWVDGSVMVRQVEIEASTLSARQEAALKAVATSMPQQTPAPSIVHELPSDGVCQPVTVLEVVAYLPPGTGTSEGFDVALNFAQQFIRSLRRVTGRSIQNVTRENLPSVIPAVTCSAAIGPEGWSEHLSLFVAKVDLQTGEREETLSTDLLDLFDYAWHTESVAGLAPHKIDLLLDAQIAFDRQGDYRAAVLNSATAVEATVDHLIAALMWEEGAHPAAAAELDWKSDFTKRMARELQPRVGGTWDSKTEGPVAEWYSECQSLRHLIVHRGYRPSAAQARGALEAARALLRYLAERLKSKALKYPRVAMKWLTLEALPRKAREKAQQLGDEEPPWDEMFDDWQIASVALSNDRPREPSIRGAEVAAVLVSGPPAFGWWVVVDRELRLAAQARPPRVGRAQVHSLDRKCEEGDLPVSIAVQVASDELEVVGDWAPIHERLVTRPPNHPYARPFDWPTPARIG